MRAANRTEGKRLRTMKEDKRKKKQQKLQARERGEDTDNDDDDEDGVKHPQFSAKGKSTE